MPRVALVTGANRGIGRAVAERLVANGVETFLAGRDLDAVQAAADELPGDLARAVRLDVTDPASVLAAARETGPVDVLVNNAAILDEGADPLTAADEDVAALLDTNLEGPWRVVRAFVPAMVERRWGRIVNVSSGAGSFAGGLWPAAPAYSVSKAALNALTVVLAARLEGTGVLVNAVDPGVVGTRMAPYAARRPKDASRSIAQLATLPDDGPHGGFFYEGDQQPW